VYCFRDGQLKREKPKPSFLQQQQQQYSQKIIDYGHEQRKETDGVKFE
jgi:hypothetical protein